MAKLTDRTTLANPVPEDKIHVVDISDTTDDPAGTSKQAELGDAVAPFFANTTVLVNALSDLPAPVGGVITLAANTNYVLGDNVSIGTDRIVGGANGSWTSNNQFGPTLTYTGTGNMFTGIDSTFQIFEARIDCPNGTCFNFSDVASPGTNIFLMSSVTIVSCSAIGTFNNLQSVVVEESQAISATDGIAISGSSWTLFSFSKFAAVSSSASFVGIDLGSAVALSAEFINLLFSAPAGAVGVSGAANSANILVNGLATFRDGNFVGGIAPISGITTDDIRWAFNSNSGLQDTQPDAMASLTNNVTETVIGVAGTPVKVAGTWVVERESHFTVDTTGKIRYDGERDITTPVNIVTTIKSASGTNKEIVVFLALNGSVIANSRSTNVVGQNDPKNNSVIWQLSLTKDNELEVFMQNDTDTINLICTDSVFRVR